MVQAVHLSGLAHNDRLDLARPALPRSSRLPVVVPVADANVLRLHLAANSKRFCNASYNSAGAPAPMMNATLPREARGSRAP